MTLVEETTVQSADLPVAAFTDHLRLGTGFSDDDVQNAVLEAHLRAAIAAVEAETGKITLSRSFLWQVTAWRDLAQQVLPVAPVTALTALAIVDRTGAAEVIDPTRYVLLPDTHRPRLAATGFCLPVIPVNGRADIRFTAGYGATWTDLPPDLASAILTLAASHYEARSGDGVKTGLPAPVRQLLARHRNLRIFGGGQG